jgi:hypothetical protein
VARINAAVMQGDAALAKVGRVASIPWLPWLLLGAAVIASFAWLLDLDSELTFIADDWLLLVKRHDLTANYFLHPFHGNIVAAPALIYKVLQGTVGMESATPYYGLALATFALSAVLLFVYLRPRVGDWLALFAAVLILFLGAAFEDLLFAFQIGYYGSVAAGLGMLICLDREDDRGDVAACILLTTSLLFSSLGIAFAAGAVLDFIFGRHPRGRRLYVPLVPISIFLFWWMGWGHVAKTYVTVDNIATTPAFVFKAASAGIVSLMGLATGDGSEPDQPHLIWGKLILVGGCLLLMARVFRERGVSKGFAVAVGIGLTFWIIAGVNRDESRLPTSSRFQYPSAVFLLLVVGESLRGLRRPPAAVIAAGVGTVLAVAGGISLLEREHSERWRPYADSLRSHLAAIEIAGHAANPNFTVFFPPDIKAPAGAYLAAIDSHGSPAFSEQELIENPTANRAGADLAIAQALNLALAPPSPSSQSLRCQGLQATADGETGLTLAPGTYGFENLGESPVELMLARFSDELSVSFGSIDPKVLTTLAIPDDASPRPWTLGLIGSGPVELCIRG